MDKETLKSADEFFKEYNINTIVDYKYRKIYVNMGDCELELSDDEVRFRARCNDKSKDYKNFTKQYNKNKLNIDEILYLKMILNSNMEEINVWNEEEKESKYADMIKNLYNKIVRIQNEKELENKK
jgi:hypothetical protein